MTALAKERILRERRVNRLKLPLAAVKCWQGGMACIDTTAGTYVTNGKASTTLVRIGIFEETVDNSGGAAGDLSATVKLDRERIGIWFANSAAGDAITAAQRFQDCYIVDDQTVAKTDATGTRSVAGKVLDVDATKGVLVEAPY